MVCGIGLSSRQRRNWFVFLDSISSMLVSVSTYSAVRLAGEVLGSDQAGEEEGDDRGLHCEDFFFFLFYSSLVFGLVLNWSSRHKKKASEVSNDRTWSNSYVERKGEIGEQKN